MMKMLKCNQKVVKIIKKKPKSSKESKGSQESQPSQQEKDTEIQKKQQEGNFRKRKYGRKG